MHQPIHSGQPLVIASWNIHKCVGTDRRFDPGRTSAVIGEIAPDIMALQEVDTRFGERRGLLDLDHLASAHGLVPVPLSPKRLAHGWHGNIILYRPDGALAGTVRNVHEADLPGLEPRGALVAEFDFANHTGLRLIAAHLGLLRRSRRQQAARLIELAGADDQPTVLLGDLNEWRTGKPSGLASLANAFSEAKPVASFPSRLPLLALDRIMANRHGLISAIEVHRTVLSRVASDHLPLKARLHLPAKA